MEKNCPCGTDLTYTNCCKPFHSFTAIANTPEALMRSRYAAYALQLADYLVATTHASQRHLHLKSDLLAWAKANTWLRLEICKADKAIVEFKAFYIQNNILQQHHERSTFLKDGKQWYYLKGEYF